MRIIWAVMKRELGLYFRSAIAYAIVFSLLLFMGLVISTNIAEISDNRLNVSATQLLVENLFNFSFLMLLFAPLLTMRLLAEEKREGTMEVLMTLPMRDSAFVIGKFLAVWIFYSVILLLTVIYAILLGTIGGIDVGQAILGYFGAWLYGGGVLAVSMIWSAVSDDQIVVAFLGVVTLLLFFFADNFSIWASGQDITANASGFIRELSLRAHYHDTLLEGVFRLHDIAYFILLIIGALFITTRLVETRRWRASA